MRLVTVCNSQSEAEEAIAVLGKVFPEVVLPEGTNFTARQYGSVWAVGVTGRCAEAKALEMGRVLDARNA